MSVEPNQVGSSTIPAPISQPNASPAEAIANQASAGQQDSGGNAVDMAKIFGEDFVKDPALKDFKDPASFVKAFKDTKAMVGKPRFDTPGKDTPPEQVAEFYKKLGVPDSADAYDLKPDANVPEHNNETNIQFLKAFGTVAHELKLTTPQAQGMQKFFDDLATNMGKTQAAQQAEEDAQLTSLLKKALPGEDIHIASERVRAEIEKVLPPDMRNLLTEKVSNEALAAIAVLEKHFRTQYGRSDKNVGDPAQGAGKSVIDLRKEAQELYANILKDGLTHPNHKSNMEKYNAMYKTIGELTSAQNKN